MTFDSNSWRFTLLALLVALAGCQTAPATKSSAEQELQRAQVTLDGFYADPEMQAFRDQLKKARAVIIAPSVTRAGFVVGGSGGDAVVLAREPRSARWAGPAFYRIGGGSVGLQIGADVSEIVMLVMSEKAFEALLSSKFTLGGDASVVAGQVGKGASGTINADVVTFARSRGAYAGVSLEGAVISANSGANQAYFGKNVSPVDILVRQNVSSPASPVSQSLSRMAR